MNITTGKVPKAQKVVLYGVEGIGKSTFASQFPDPLFIDTEDSTLHMDVKRFDKPTSWEMLKQQVDYVKQNRPCQTLVIDTMDWAEDLCKRHLMAANGWNAIDSEGYGKKFVALAEQMGGLLNKLSEVIDMGINVVVTAHAMLRKKEEPDEMGAFDRYELKLEKKTAPLVKEWADMVLFANYKTTVITDSKTNSKKATGGQRMMYTTHRPAWDAKNRIGLADELPFEYVQIVQAFSEVTQPQPVQNTVTEQNQPVQPEPNFGPERNEEIPAIIPRAVADLMTHDNVGVDEIMQVIYQGGFMPADTPIENVPQDLWGYLSTNWDKAMSLLNTQIRKF
ncbi:ATP-binding protein [Enterococcus pseudoavium]|uniref:ATP-binding protein n=1 Tax=Enterococcus pseudoavium TaxID=44007 RepID=A0ABU3FHJ6_9ENTE|nr:ATP-binding protein [Enterococcus pseudoavium]MDT2770527.1 ATP-binding protein [Enterococcus pseudoavium]